MKKPPERFWTREAIAFVATQLDLRNEPSMQDLAYEVAEPEALDQYLSLFEEMQGSDDVRFVLADIIIQSFEMLVATTQADARWNLFLNELSSNTALHGHQIWYWSAFDTPLKEAWNVTSDMRRLSENLA
jgi:hypothetical protein